MQKLLFGLLMFLLSSLAFAQEQANKNTKFEQLGTLLPTPNTYRSASGAPGYEYWQQKADYDISVTLDDEKQQIRGKETITYTNNSPDALTYLWLQLDQNMRAKDSDTYKTATAELNENVSFNELKQLFPKTFDGGFKIEEVTDKSGVKLPYVINKTMMRVDLPKPLHKGEKFVFQVRWWYNINDQLAIGGRSGYEYFAEDDNYLYEIAQFYPRMAVYDDVNGWQHKQFLGRGEFALTFGDYTVSITAPADHIVGASGELQNAQAVLSSTQQSRLKQARTSDKPIVIVTEEEARTAEKSKAKETKTWIFKAVNVRDFAWASSRKFVWDAMNVSLGNKNVLCMSYYPKEGNPLWGKYSTEVVAQTVRTYSKYTIDYPYPVAISVHGPVWGMEYPMICFNGGRPNSDGTYPEGIKHAMISVIIHEVGHNFFPMIINSDERQWTWMDEGLNTFLQYLTEKEWQREYPSRRGPAYKIVDYMKGDKANITPIMTNSEQLLQFGNNAYAKPATALNILRETIMGRELFDYAFKEYARRWAFKHPEPADFFRTMEDASGVDLDWFWRSWFYTTDHVDIGIADMRYFRVDTKNPVIEKERLKKENAAIRTDISDSLNRTSIVKSRVEMNPSLLDMYDSIDPYTVSEEDKKMYDRMLQMYSEEERAFLEKNDAHFYELTFENIGGIPMPIILEVVFEDNSTETIRIPAEIWRYNYEKVSKVFYFTKPVTQFVLDPLRETADTEEGNNYFPNKTMPSRFQLYKRGSEYGRRGR